MRSVLGFLIATVLSLNSTSVNAQTILPDSVVSQIVDELIVKDHLTFTVNRQDSIIRIYEAKDIYYENEIAQFKLKDKDYEEIVTKLNAVIKLRESEVKDLIKHEKKVKAKATAIQIGLGVVILLIIIL